MDINRKKTKTMIISRKYKHTICIEKQNLKQERKLKYLRSTIAHNEKQKEKQRQGKKLISKEIKVKRFKKVDISITTYGSDPRTTTDKNKSKIEATEIRFLRKIENETIRMIILSEKNKINNIDRSKKVN